MAVKDTKLEEKEQLVVHGDIIADSFKDRTTGKSIGETHTSEWEQKLKEHLVYDEENEEVQCGTDYYADGSVETGADVVVGRNLIIDDLTKFQNTNGDKLIELVPKATFEGGEFVTHTGIIYVVYNTDGTCYVRYYIS